MDRGGGTGGRGNSLIWTGEAGLFITTWEWDLRQFLSSDAKEQSLIPSHSAASDTQRCSPIHLGGEGRGGEGRGGEGRGGEGRGGEGRGGEGRGGRRREERGEGRGEII